MQISTCLVLADWVGRNEALPSKLNGFMHDYFDRVEIDCHAENNGHIYQTNRGQLCSATQAPVCRVAQVPCTWGRLHAIATWPRTSVELAQINICCPSIDTAFFRRNLLPTNPRQTPPVVGPQLKQSQTSEATDESFLKMADTTVYRAGTTAPVNIAVVKYALLFEPPPRHLGDP